jgi:hypothetical protein
MQCAVMDRTFKNIIQDLIAGDFLGRDVFVLMIMLGLMIFGCVETPAEQPAAEEITTEEESTPKETTEPETAQQPETTGEGTDLTDLTYFELASLGVPIKCEITSTYQGITTTATLYMVGEDKMRMEVPSEGRTMVSLLLDKTLYVKNVMADMYPECEWLRMEHEEMAEPTEMEEGEYIYESPSAELEDIPPQDFDCEVWVYDESKFTPPTENVCTQEEFNEVIMQQYDIPDYPQYE